MHRWFHPAFQEEPIAAARYYKRQSPGLGAQFLLAAEAELEAVAAAPNRWPVRRLNIRTFRVTRFPYTIRYRLRADTLEFLGITHGARRPDLGLDR